MGNKTRKNILIFYWSTKTEKEKEEKHQEYWTGTGEKKNNNNQFYFVKFMLFLSIIKRFYWIFFMLI